MRQTYFAKPGEVEKQWHIIDGDGQRLGRMAVQIVSWETAMRDKK